MPREGRNPCSRRWLHPEMSPNKWIPKLRFSPTEIGHSRCRRHGLLECRGGVETHATISHQRSAWCSPRQGARFPAEEKAPLQPPPVRQLESTTLQNLLVFRRTTHYLPVPALSTVCSGGSSASKRLTIKAWKNPAGRSASGVTVPDVTRLSRKVCAFGRRGECSRRFLRDNVRETNNSEQRARRSCVV